jgi:hypothetical protein
MLWILGVSISGSVRFWTKIINQTKIIFFSSFWTEPNWKPVRTNHIQFGSVFCLPNQFKPKLFQLSFYSEFFHWPYFFRNSILVLFLISQICAYFYRSVLSQHGFFLKWLGMYDKQEERTEVIWLEKKNKGKIKR